MANNGGVSWFGESGTPKNIVKKTGKGIVKVGTIIGAGILLGMGFEAFRGASEGN